jgi:hypothetical protein
MDRMARQLWETGAQLTEAVSETFAGLKYEVESITGNGPALAVKLDAKRRLLVHVSAAESALEKKSPELATVFQMVQTMAGSDDRVVLVTNGDRMTAPKSRPAAMSPEALALVTKLGVNVLPGPAVFALWSMSQQEQSRARAYLDKLHAQDGGLAAAPQ